MSTCDICLKISENLSVVSSGNENSDVYKKLVLIVQSLEIEDFLFCLQCIEEINKVNEFRELCIRSFELKNQQNVTEDVYDDVPSPIEEKIIKKTKKLRKKVKSDLNLIETDKNGGFMCSKCKKSCKNKYLLKRHIKIVHGTKTFKCKICERVFAALKYLKAHEKYHTGDRTHICTYCGKGFITPAELGNHEKIHINKRAYKCEICPKAFNTSSDLYKHKICIHSDKSLWKYVCSYCTKRFPLKINLDTHSKTHTGEKNFECHLCQKKFTTKSSVNRHIQTHSNFHSFKCSICLQSYKYEKSLQEHLYKVHNIGNEVPMKKKQFICHVCPKSYTAINKLEKHIRTHTGERPFNCTQCEKTFIDKSYVKQHEKIAHTNIENKN